MHWCLSWSPTLRLSSWTLKAERLPRQQGEAAVTDHLESPLISDIYDIFFKICSVPDDKVILEVLNSLPEQLFNVITADK